MGHRIKGHWYRKSCVKRSETLIVEPLDVIHQDRIYGELPDSVMLTPRLRKDGLFPPGSIVTPIATLLRRQGGNYNGRRGTFYWLRVWAIPIGEGEYAIYRQVGANRKTGRPRIMRVGMAVCPGLEIERE